MLSRLQVVRAYKKACRGLAHGSKSLRILDQLPPFLCRTIAAGAHENYSRILSDQRIAFTGSAHGFLDFWPRVSAARSVAVFVGAHKLPVVRELPLLFHKATSEGHCKSRHLFGILEDMAREDHERLSNILSWTSLIVWMEKDERDDSAGDGLLTSSTFPEFPHCTFLTDKCLRHIPPNGVADFDSQYAIWENLYHESLHQQLAALLLHRDILDPSYSANTTVKIPVPWRSAAWEPDRVFHAIYVYSKVAQMRMEKLERLSSRDPEFMWLSDAFHSGVNALCYLVEQMDDRTEIFTDAGRKIYARIRHEAHTRLQQYQSMHLKGSRYARAVQFV
jgi:hypothetical protein